MSNALKQAMLISGRFPLLLWSSTLLHFVLSGRQALVSTQTCTVSPERSECWDPRCDCCRPLLLRRRKDKQQTDWTFGRLPLYFTATSAEVIVREFCPWLHDDLLLKWSAILRFLSVSSVLHTSGIISARWDHDVYLFHIFHLSTSFPHSWLK